ncbi:MAG: AEC family transporter [Dermatophilus congolensis]|nr:AEC family transporter [Dermatophilus congolensis]
MGNVLIGFAIIAIIIGLGAVLARVGVLADADRATLSRLTFLVASPALLFDILSKADLAHVFSVNLAATVISVAAAFVVYQLIDVVLVRLRRAPAANRSERLITGMTGVYVNAGNLGLPVATYVLGNPAFMAPALLLQLLVLQPFTLGFLDNERSRAGGGAGWLAIASLPFRNPMTIGSALGVLVAYTGVVPPTWLTEPISMVGGMAVPGMLLAFGASLVLGPKFGASGSMWRVGSASLVKLLVQPLTAFAAASALGGSPEIVFAATVTASLPAAQNLFIIASRYDAAAPLVRDIILATTFGSLPVVFAASYLLH